MSASHHGYEKLVGDVIQANHHTRNLPQDALPQVSDVGNNSTIG
jgi:hypothetical protein